MYYTVYKTTNKINNKIYIGCHKTDDLEDGYMGSGKVLKRSIEKYGTKSFKKEYLHIFDNPEDMFEMESTLVNEDFVKEDTNYNLKPGGKGGFDYINNNKLNVYPNIGNIGHGGENLLHGIKLKKHLVENDKYEQWKKNISVTLKRLYKNGLIESPFIGKKHSNEAKLKIGKANSIKQKGNKNSQHGSMWIYNLELKENKKIKKDSTIPDGWVKGRKMFK